MYSLTWIFPWVLFAGSMIVTLYRTKADLFMLENSSWIVSLYHYLRTGLMNERFGTSASHHLRKHAMKSEVKPKNPQKFNKLNLTEIQLEWIHPMIIQIYIFITQSVVNNCARTCSLYDCKIKCIDSMHAISRSFSVWGQCRAGNLVVL